MDHPDIDRISNKTTREVSFKDSQLPLLPIGLNADPENQITSTAAGETAEELAQDEPTMDPSHPLLSRVQAAMFEQLTRHKKRFELEIKEQEEEARKVASNREIAGVELYNAQQQLAKTQNAVEEAEENLITIRNLRQESERALKLVNSYHKDEKQKMEVHQKKLHHNNEELNKIGKAFRQFELYNESTRSKILIAKRSTLKADKDIQQQEIEKKRQVNMSFIQDYFINNLTEQIKTLQEKRELYADQKKSQQSETKEATETLQDAMAEMEAIHLEKRQLMNQWKSSLIGLKRRDEVYQETEKAIEKINEKEEELGLEISGYKRSFKIAQENSENLFDVSKKLENDLESIRTKISEYREEQNGTLAESFSLYSNSLEETELKLSAVRNEKSSATLKSNAMQKELVKLGQKKHLMEREIAEKLQSHASLDKGTKSVLKEGQKRRDSLNDKDLSLVAVENDLSLCKLDVLKTTGKIEMLETKFKEIDGELQDKNLLVERYEIEIRRCNDEVAQKSSDIELLNKKFSKASFESENGNMGTLEATIHNLSKSIHQKEKESFDLQRFWLKAQIEMVQMNTSTDDLEDKKQDLKVQLAIFNRKDLVLGNAILTEENETKQHLRNIKQLQKDMQKVNVLLGKQNGNFGVLEEHNMELEQVFRGRLKEAEVESLQMEDALEHSREEKKKALRGLIESERQILLWDKKIQLAKETRSALDPNIGATEIREMTLEIHRMSLRYANMMKLQEKLISEIESTVYRRETISIKGKLKGKGTQQMALIKTIGELKLKIKQTIREVHDCKQDSSTLENQINQIQIQIQDSAEQNRELCDSEKDLNVALELNLFEKQSALNETLVYQKLQRHYQNFRDKKYIFAIVDDNARVTELSKANNRVEKISALLQNAQGCMPLALQPPINKLDEFLMTASKVIEFEI